MTTPINWNREARRLLKGELARREIGYKALSRALERFGIDEDPKVLSTKINRGTFSFAFFLQCMRALDIDTVRVRDE
ncbi:DUF6471 domain-containing protein [Pseudazoarcus pumilus]|uniref:DUF6471 domain-containing protein n=1 Tax=Pseudazoarcus pumilus TaxID=2067960 RepID=A0A2I6S9B4_9RHOO|nr:DUF6471 domain-containing protein [Pseudazoarcus pumilus]AUN95856.1 hypothetical protein C0099_13510 [Pseudazoarcus pumilus]